MQNEVSLVILALNPETSSGVSIASIEGKLPTTDVQDEEELLDTAVRLAWDYGVDVMMDCALIPLPVRDEVDRKEQRTICHPFMILLPNMPGDKIEWVDIASIDVLDHKRIIRSGYAFLRKHVGSTTIALAFLDGPFTVQQYRRLCEQLVNDGSEHKMLKLHPSNFRRKFEKILSTDLCFIPTGDIVSGRGGSVNTYEPLGVCPLTWYSTKLFD